MIDFELKLPATKKTRDQIIKDWMINSAKRTSSKGAYDRFKKRILDARKKDDELKKKKRINALDYVDSMVALHEPDIATNRQKAVLKIQEDKASEIEAAIRKRNIGDKNLEKYFNKKRGDFLTLQEKAKKLKALHAKKPKPNIQLNNPLSNPETDNFLELIDSGGWASPEDEGKRRAGILEQDLANEYWQEQYENYLNGGGTLSYQQFMQQQLTIKVSKKINQIAEEKKQVEGLATLVGAPDEIRKLFNDTNNRKIPRKI